MLCDFLGAGGRARVAPATTIVAPWKRIARATPHTVRPPVELGALVDGLSCGESGTVTDPLASVHMKLARAALHFDLLNSQIMAFLDTEPYAAEVREFDPQTQSFAIRSVVKTYPAPGWSLLVADCIYNLRSALDHLAWTLATDPKTGEAPARTEFPIFLERAKYQASSKSGTPERGSGLYKVRGMAMGAQAAIEALQPYNRLDGPPELHPLWLLHQLSNEDKHRVLSIIGTVMEDSDLTLHLPPIDAEFSLDFEYGIPLEQEAEIGRLIFRPTGPKAKVDFEVAGTFFVAFGKSGAGRGRRVADTLADIANFIAQRVLPELEHFVWAS